MSFSFIVAGEVNITIKGGETLANRPVLWDGPNMGEAKIVKHRVNITQG